MLTDVLREIKGRRRFVISSHARPDGDAVGSALALADILRRLDKMVDVVLHDPVPVIYQPLPFAESVIHSREVPGSYDAAILLECDSVQRTRLEGLERNFLINIDHHVTGRPYAHVNWIDSSACSTAELVWRLARAANVEITPDVATCLYAAVLADTGSFCYSGTTAETLGLAQELVRCGAHPARIAQQVYFTNPTSKMRLLGAALGNLHREHDLAWMFCTRSDIARCGALDEDAEGLVNYGLAIAGVEIAVFLRELPDQRFRVSLRSKGAVDVATVAENFGGGGHHCAGGFSIDGPLAVALERVLSALRMTASAPPADATPELRPTN
ncbi:MAG: bifunctional oligoribonuclease/PAP phosphatase NrnA [Acidobacteria bacterium]|nr:bifunctional oligoribonuclease/PAP phosphatase NrnA [Acidobacteriota bacterium]